MRTPWKHLVDVMSKKFQEEIKVCAEDCSDSTSAKVSTDGADDDSQQGPEHTEARPRADRSSVAGCNDADLEQTAAQSPSTMLQISSRQQTSLRRESEMRDESRRGKLHQTEAKPADSECTKPSQQRRIRIQQKDGVQQQDETSFSRRFVPQRKTQKTWVAPACMPEKDTRVISTREEEVAV